MCEVNSYSVTIIGGIPHTIKSSPSNMAQEQSTSKSNSPTILPEKPNKEKKSFRSRLAEKRRISCKDLGLGDCQGYLYKKNDSKSHGNKFSKMWFVLKHKDLYYYKHPNDLKAKGIIHLPVFQVSPTEIKGMKYAFKVHNHGTMFCFASDRQDDQSKWMDKMSLATLPDIDVSEDTTDLNVGPKGLSIINEVMANSSDSEDDDPKKEDPGLLPATSCDDLKAVATLIMRTNICFLEGDKRYQRRIDSLATTPKGLNIDIVKNLTSLQRTLMVKEKELNTIQELLQNTDVSSNTLQTFRAQHPDIITSMEEARIESDANECEDTQL